MAKDSTIEWTHHTFNPWWGCVKVSEGCKHCYAESWAKRVGSNVWGPRNSRRFLSDRHWEEPLKWDQEADQQGTRKRVFCASMADVFEPRSDLIQWRSRLWDLISKTPHLDWLLLTKRPENVRELVPWHESWPHNIWLGATAENQVRANERLPILVKYPAAVRFLSCEPLLGPIDLQSAANCGVSMDQVDQKNNLSGIHWVIAGGESGPKARPMHPEWARSLRDQCQREGIAFHFKQWGHWAPSVGPLSDHDGKQIEMTDSKGTRSSLACVGKKKAGRILDGRTWDDFPVTV